MTKEKTEQKEATATPPPTPPKHSPAPWTTIKNYEDIDAEIKDAIGNLVTSFYIEPSKADARLIAAAPQLLVAVKLLLRAGTYEDYEALGGKKNEFRYIPRDEVEGLASDLIQKIEGGTEK
jgi:hypothetical protein